MIQQALLKQLSLILPNTNKALQEVLKSASPQELESLSKQKDLASILLSLFDKSAKDPMQNSRLLHLLQNNPTLKSLGTIHTSLQNLSQLLGDEKENKELQKSLKNMLQNIATIDEKGLKSKIENSGVFLESKLKSAAQTPLPKEQLTQDLKSQLLQTRQELESATTPKTQEIARQVDKLLLQIDYYQLSSHLLHGSSLYIPYAWDMLEEGNITLKQDKEEHFFCDIELRLKEYGEIKLRLGLFSSNLLNINISSQSQELKSLIKEHLKELKKALFSIGITPGEIRFVDEKKVQTPYGDTAQKLQMGFEVKV